MPIGAALALRARVGTGARRDDAPPRRARARSAARALGVLWRFSRPHTIIGTTLSIVGLYAIAVAETSAPPATTCSYPDRRPHVNIAIVGVNQITDVGIDRVNKPWLPIAAGDLS